MVRSDLMLLFLFVVDPWCPCVLLAFSKIIPYKTHPSQSFTSEPVRTDLTFEFVVLDRLFLM